MRQEDYKTQYTSGLWNSPYQHHWRWEAFVKFGETAFWYFIRILHWKNHLDLKEWTGFIIKLWHISGIDLSPALIILFIKNTWISFLLLLHYRQAVIRCCDARAPVLLTPVLFWSSCRCFTWACSPSGLWTLQNSAKCQHQCYRPYPASSSQSHRTPTPACSQLYLTTHQIQWNWVQRVSTGSAGHPALLSQFRGVLSGRNTSRGESSSKYKVPTYTTTIYHQITTGKVDYIWYARVNNSA